METSVGWDLLVKWLDSEMINNVAKLATPATSVDSLITKEYSHGAIAETLRLQGAPNELRGVIQYELDNRVERNEEDAEEND